MAADRNGGLGEAAAWSCIVYADFGKRCNRPTFLKPRTTTVRCGPVRHTSQDQRRNRFSPPHDLTKVAASEYPFSTGHYQAVCLALLLVPHRRVRLPGKCRRSSSMPTPNRPIIDEVDCDMVGSDRVSQNLPQILR